jgi:hypothetical protein
LSSESAITLSGELQVVVTQGFGGGSAASVVVAAMAMKIVLCLVLVVTMVVAAHARLISGSGGFPEVRYQTATGGRLISGSFGSTEAVEGDNDQTKAYDFSDFNRMQEDTSTMTNSFSDSFPTETFPNFAAADDSFATETNNYVNPGQGVSYNYATDTTATDNYDKGIDARRSAGIRGATGGGDGKAASFTLDTEKTDSVVWTESDP